jgi:cell wall-associated NlpC family hydrolase
VFWASEQADPSTIYHVAIAVSANQVVQAPYTGESVEVTSIWGPGLVTVATRP